VITIAGNPRPKKTAFLVSGSQPLRRDSGIGDVETRIGFNKMPILTAQDLHFEQSGPVISISEAQMFQDPTNAKEKPIMFRQFRALVHLAPGQFLIVEEEKE